MSATDEAGEASRWLRLAGRFRWPGGMPCRWPGMTAVDMTWTGSRSPLASAPGLAGSYRG
jgi:hypothetical protein